MPVRLARLSCGMAARAKPAKRRIPNPPCETSFLVMELTVSLGQFLVPASVRQFGSTLSTLAPRALEETRCTKWELWKESGARDLRTRVDRVTVVRAATKRSED